ncbi:MAG: feruloyl-CoA synthase [Alphaproteobacteria bacterium]|nr:feruloyl-CoA synthase [Alphaproteobacteria bacterium]MBU1515325.1 feruloyl-CoA synthase [Alphaproteobacteria bacterium]MBU2095375.1 feruloyl-CoA synthase [Alphaproteobacteria bacterium]MBU2152605.1 feruloyl-CoA synthase [Alphaproteobacteria bacterium]MBU2310001.1 feruloyl-CoA synthase [Alphaproteobacteria bacterium]
MDAELNISTAPFRDPRYAPRQLEVVERPGGEFVLTNTASFSTQFQTTTASLTHWAAAAPDRIWLAERSGEGWRTVTYAEAWQRIGALAAGLRGLGVVGERPLLILARNGVDHALIAYAAMSQGMPVAPVSPQYGLPGANLARLAHACQVLNPAAVFTEDAALFAEGLSSDVLAGLPVIALANARPGDVALDALYGAGVAQPTATPDQHAKYLLTSGSTGLPKAVICTHRQMSLNSAQITACFDDPDPLVMVHSAPWSHSLGANSILHYAAHRGGSLYIDAGQPTAAKFGETVRNLREVSPTYQNMVPAAWMLFADELEKDDTLARAFFSRVRLLQYGGAALGQATADRIQAVAVRTVGERISFGSGYGATETGPTACNVHWTNARMGMIGAPLPGTSVRLVPEAGKLDFRVKGPQVTSGYLGRPELSAAAFDEEGFYRLGDAARFVDPADPKAGMIFDGRLSENFKLVSGTFVSVGELRIGAIGAIGDAVTDAVVCGESREAVGLLLYPNPTMPRDLIQDAVRAGIVAFNARSKGSGGRVARALVLPDAPDAASGEITDKGYIAQSLARTRRAEAIDRLFADPASSDVMVF